MRRLWSSGPRSGAAAAFAHTRAPARDTPWRAARWCAVDLELTGLDPRSNDIIAIGAVPIEEGRVVLGESAYTLVRSSRRSEHAAVLVHKLRLPDVADAPVLDEALGLLFSVLAGRVPVFHTAAVERNFLRPLFARRRVRLPDAADTEALGRRWLQRRDGETPGWLSLARVAELLGLPAEPPHHALGDALTTAKAFIALASHLDAAEPQTVGTLVGGGSGPGGVRRFGPGVCHI
jgi:DNA polymerase III subunit epsilon